MNNSVHGLLERLADGGVVVGDGSCVFTLEKRGYVTAGAWTPEACVLHPEAVRQLHREYLRAGADVIQTATFYSSDKQLQHVATFFKQDTTFKDLTTDAINDAAVDLAKSVAKEGGALVAGSVSPVMLESFKEGKKYVQEEIRKQTEVFRRKEVDFILGEFFVNIEEAEWAIETMAEAGVPVACTMRIPPKGDASGISPQECAVRMAKAGAAVVGVNCMYDPTISLKTIALMKEGLQKAGLQTHLMVQPMGFHAQDPGVEDDPRGYNALPEMPFAMESRSLTRIDVHRFAREAYDLGVRYIGGCCGFEPHHIRAISLELAKERGRYPPCSQPHNMSPWKCLTASNEKSFRPKSTWEYWSELTPATGRHTKTFTALCPKE